MDKVKEMASKASGKGGSSSGGGAGGKQDYGDKGLASVEKSTGLPQNAKANEMITDKGREGIEGATGKNIPDKVSN